MDNLKHRLRKLKQSEKNIRWGGDPAPGASLVWDAFFYVKTPPSGQARYSLAALEALNREDYKRIVDEFYAHVYYEYYLENGMSGAKDYDPSVLAQLSLPYDAQEQDVKKRFRELAMKHHPDKGGDAAKFVELMQVYEKLACRR